MYPQRASAAAKRLTGVIGILNQSATIEEALPELQRHELAHSEDAVRMLLRRADLGKVSDHLGTALVANRDFVDRVPDNDDGPPTLQGGFASVTSGAEAVNESSADRLHRLLLIPDLHAPFHCEKAWALLLRAARVLKPDTIVVLGDFADFVSVSAHDKNPSRLSSLESEIAVVKEKLDELVELQATRIVYISGNHEFRYERYLMSKAPALWGMMTLPEVLGLAERGIEWVPYMRSIKIGSVTFTHDVGEAGVYAIKRARDAAEGNIVIGHVHSMGLHYSGTATGKVKVGGAFGWLGKVEEAGDYMHLLKANRSWTHGFGIGMMEPNGTMHLQAIPMIDGRCVVNGVLVK